MLIHIVRDIVPVLRNRLWYAIQDCYSINLGAEIKRDPHLRHCEEKKERKKEKTNSERKKSSRSWGSLNNIWDGDRFYQCGKINQC